MIAPEQVLTFRIEAPVTIVTDRSPQAFRYVQPNEYNQPVYNQPSPQYAAAPSPAYAAPYYGYGYPYPYYYPYYGPSFSFFVGPRFYGRPYYYGRGYYGFRRR